MEAKAKSMAQKRLRHYNETKSIVAASLVIFGLCFSMSLIVLWPQSFLVNVFNSRLLYKLILDNEDYFTCDKEYNTFVIDEPSDSFAMMSFYVFNVSNAYEVLERGDPPVVTETGPFAFIKNTYRYDIYFEPEDSTTVTYKEFSYLRPVEDPDSCEAMFYRLERNYESTDPCSGSACKCKSYKDYVTVVNPLFLKMMWEDSPFELLAYYSQEVFQTQKEYLDKPFTEAVKAHLVSKALKEVYYFRILMHVGDIVKTGLDNLLLQNSLADITTWLVPPTSTCGLDIYDIIICPFAPYNSFLQVKNTSLPDSVYPPLHYMFNTSYSFAVVNLTHAFSKWVGLAWHLNLIDFNSQNGYTMVNATAMQAVLDEYVAELGYLHFGTYALTADQRAGTTLSIRAVALFLVRSFLSNYRVSENTVDRVYVEFNSTSDPVICAPLGETCVYQYGYVQRAAGGSLFPLNAALIRALIDIATEVGTEANNFYKDLNAPRWYNVYVYYHHILHNATYPDLSCTNYGYTITDATFTQPASLWGSYRGISAVNTTRLYNLYRAQSAAEKAIYFDLATNLSVLLFDVYRQSSSFHDHFTINYINKFKSKNLTHTFSVDAFEELGYAQWGGGFITDALVSVRSTKQVVHDGMWRFGLDKYYNLYHEFASYAITQGFPHTYVYDVDDARRLLSALAANTVDGVAFRKHIMYIGSTLIGDGQNFTNDVGHVGEVAFTREANRGDFTCNGTYAYECSLLTEMFPSSASQCNEVQQLFLTCQDQYTYQTVNWINYDNCAEFETSITSPSTGIQCNSISVYGNAHPYVKSRGNVVFQMLYSLAVKIVLWDSLWCSVSYFNIENNININNRCQYDRGGLFATMTVEQLLFTGYTEPSVLKYMDKKFSLLYNMSFECVNTPYDICRVKQYTCDEAGVKMVFKGDVEGGPNRTFVMRYNSTSNEEYFAPYFMLTDTRQLLWPYAMNATVQALSKNAIVRANNASVSPFQGLNGSDTAVRSLYYSRYQNITNTYKFRNIIWTAFPAWHDNPNRKNDDFLKYYQCQNRILFGNVDQFHSCEHTLYTGRDDYRRVLQLRSFYGNESIQPYFNTPHTLNFNSSDYHFQRNLNRTRISFDVGGSLINNQYTLFRYDGFMTYPYVYGGIEAGASYGSLQDPLMFNKMFALPSKMSQKDLIFAFQRDITLTLPLTTGTIPHTTFRPFSVPTRRFTETEDTWSSFRSAARPLDAYSMPYTVPKAMASLQSLTNFPIFVETPNSYGNMQWGGIEYTHIRGFSQNQYSQRTYIDYDPVTGRALRSAARQQVSIRVEANALLQNVFSSQQRCTPPSKAFAQGSGYGCFTYMPLFWVEDARVLDNAMLYRYYDHFYTRPERGNVLTLAGIGLGTILVVVGSCLYVSESYQRSRFKSRVYVD